MPTAPDREVVNGPPLEAGMRSVTVPVKASVETVAGASPERVRVTARWSAESAETAVTVPAGDTVHAAGLATAGDAARSMGLEKVTVTDVSEATRTVATAGATRSP